jgi:predicted phage terminase large subunit-like protein
VQTLTESDIQLLLANLHTMSTSEQCALLDDLEVLEQRKQVEEARVDFLKFAHRVYPNFKEGPHHRHMKPLLHGLKDNTEPRLTVSMPPRFGKSETIAYLFVAWYLGHFPRHQIMMVTHTADLSADFGRKVRNLLDSEVYHEIFPDTVVARDKSAASNWSTTLGGKYLAIGIGANVAGHGADLLIGDDLVSEQAVLSSDPDKTFAQAWEYMQVGPLQRLMPNGKIIMIGTRWGKKDPIGRALQWAEQNSDSTPWKEVRFPALMDVKRGGVDTTVSLWPEQWPIDQLLAKKAGMFPQFWAAQYMQEPTSEEGALVKREWWRIWPHEKPPKCDFLMQSWDTAHGQNDSADPSGVQTWGIFFNEDDNQDQLILLDAWKGRKEFPALKKFALDYYKEWEPDSVIIEKKAAGAPLIQELRAIGIPVQEYTPSRGADKRVRLNSVADIFASGMVWRPDTRWAQEVVDEIAEFPNGEHDEMVDTASQALMRFRQGGFIRFKSDENDDNERVVRRRAAYY